jgi:hypothetical protein
MGWREEPATAKQKNFVRSLASKRDLSEVDDVALDLFADLESGAPITGGQASILIDTFKAAPFQSRQPQQEKALTSDRAERLAALSRAKAEAETAEAVAEVAKAAAGGHTALEGQCVKCGHSHNHQGITYVAAEDGTCGASVEVRMSDYSEYYACSCTETARGTAASHEAHRLATVALRASNAVWQYQQDADAVRKGDMVVNVRGRKIAKGTTGQVIATNNNGYGPSVLMLLSDGQKVWTALSNVEHVEVK